MFSVIYKLEFYIRLCYKIFSLRNMHHVKAPHYMLAYISVTAMHVGQLFKAPSNSVHCLLCCVFREDRMMRKAAYASVYVSVT